MGSEDEREPDELVERIGTGASVQVEITRGTGTRDQDKWRVKGKGEDAGQALAELREQLESVFPVDEDEPLGEQVRAFQPDAGEEDGDDE